MNLFVNAVSKNTCLILFDNKRKIINKEIIEIKGNESSLLIPNIDRFLQKNSLTYFDLQNIVVVNGPGSFTWVRTIVLTINTIAFVTNTKLTSCSYFELFKDYPIIKNSSKRDSFFKKNKNSEIEIILNEELENYILKNKIEKIYWEWDIKNVEIIENIDYSDIIENIKLDKKTKKIEALYIKKPNIC